MSQKKNKVKQKPSGKSFNKPNKIRLIGVIVVIVSLIGYFVISQMNVKKINETAVKGYTAFDFKKHGELSFNNSAGEFISKIDIEIADDNYEREVGLMNRSNMEETQGMFFIFNDEDYQSFWMKNTQLSLDIMFVNSKNEIVKIHHNTAPFSLDGLPSDAPAIYVVEVVAGYSIRNGIKAGDKIVWRRI